MPCFCEKKQVMYCVTYLPHAVGGTKTLSLPFISPGFEQVLEHRGLPSLGHHLHTGAGRVVLGFDVALVEKFINDCYLTTKKNHDIK